MPRPGSREQRGYGYRHRKTRALLIKDAIGKPCVRCGRRIMPGDPIDLDHTDDRAGYLGFACQKCNRSAGAKKGNANRKRRQRRRTRTSRRW